MSDYHRFACQLKSPDAAPEPFRPALRDALAGGDDARLLILTPPSETLRFDHGPMVLAVTDRGWVCIEHTRRGAVTVAQSGFPGTLCVEQTSILLNGALRIFFADGPHSRAVAMEFNTVMERLYFQALQLLLHGIAGVAPGPIVDRRADLPVLEPLPLKFLNSAWSRTPPDEHVRAIAHWPAAVATYHRWFQRELTPEAMFALGARELVFIAEEKARWSLRISRENKYGDIATYLPLSRLSEFRFLDGAGPLGELELTVGAAGASETLTVEFPSAHRASIQGIVERAFREKAQFPAAHDHPLA